ncbi:glycosyltransferase family 2 protein [Annulohypoxylon maeteangense]|uniref:glycosyltransferase family 2 protein n=1 Tax=Annulohypoxylon maeteangense TaxID=1927788 RepID=UPI0020078C03|nr:glycosyltransferase family 2 protein [Annulohypoxylon maeteangense]KAI0882316.1 glycosyltransferase family 2 protein [Annulohypoxylon maeteangense]
MSCFTLDNIHIACLFGHYLWDAAEASESRHYAARYRPFPIPPPHEALFGSSNVSIICPTIDWDDDLPANLMTWLKCRPREVIFVTLESEADKLSKVLESAPGLRKAVEASGAIINVATVQQANKRTQLCHGINQASGQILCLVDDDAKWTTDQVLTQLLAPFQDLDVGLVGGPIGSYVPEERQNSNIITPWEVAALRTRSRRGPGMAEFYAADGSTNFTVSGLTMLLRGEIVRDPYFQYLFTHDMWNGIRQNTGDDAFITRYILFQHQLSHRHHSNVPHKQWKLGMQLTPEAEVLTSLMTDGRYASQSKRWFRTGLRIRLTCLLYEPGILGMRSTAPYMAYKMTRGMCKPFSTAFRLYLWMYLWFTHPIIAAIFLVFYVLRNWCTSLRAFHRQYPYCGKKIWAAMIADNLYLITDIYSYLTLSTESWSNRSSVPGVVE